MDCMHNVTLAGILNYLYSSSSIYEDSDKHHGHHEPDYSAASVDVSIYGRFLTKLSIRTMNELHVD